RYRALVEAQPVLPGVHDTLVAAKRLGLKLGVASSSTRDWVEGHLTRLDLVAQFACIRCAEDVRQTKPNPELYLSALEALGVPPDAAIALEDSPNGIRAAKRAGLFCVAVPNPLTLRLGLDEADLRLNSLAEMPLETLLLEVQARRGSK